MPVYYNLMKDLVSEETGTAVWVGRWNTKYGIKQAPVRRQSEALVLRCRSNEGLTLQTLASLEGGNLTLNLSNTKF